MQVPALLLVAGFFGLAAGQCPSGFVNNGQSCYLFVRSSLNWFDADQYCTYRMPKQYNVHLVAIEQFSEQTFLNSYITGSSDLRDRDYWIGGNSNHGDRYGWKWVSTNSVFGYTNWASGEPDGQGRCVQMWSSENYQWDDIDCTSNRRRFICEMEL